MTPASFDPPSYLVARVQFFKPRTTDRNGHYIHTYVVAKKSAINLNTSVSLFVVSSNPGVSISTTRLPSSVNSFASWTSSVHDSRLSPTCSFELLARLMN